MKPTHINKNTIIQIHDEVDIALAASKEYQVSITLFDNSLRARQRALARCWYAEIADFLGESIGYAEALVKYKWGLRIRCLNDPELEAIVRKMLDGYSFEKKLEIIEQYSSWFPILRDKGGLDIEGQARYLNCMQVNFANDGLLLSSPKERDLLNCKEANK